MEMKAGPADDQDDVLPPLPVQTEEVFLELEGMIKDPTLGKKLVSVFYDHLFCLDVLLTVFSLSLQITYISLCGGQSEKAAVKLAWL